MCVGGGEVGSKSSRKSRRHRKQSGTRPLWASWGGWGTPLQDPLPAPTTTLRLQPPSEGRPLVSWEISKTGTPWNPCLTHHFHRFPQQVKESLDHLPLAETFFFFFSFLPNLSPPPPHSTWKGFFYPHTATGIMTSRSAQPFLPLPFPQRDTRAVP